MRGLPRLARITARLIVRRLNLYHDHACCSQVPADAAEKRPQDPHLDGRDLKFETLEHGGAEPDTMPNAIRVTDPQGRTADYVLLSIDGKVVGIDGKVVGNESQRP